MNSDPKWRSQQRVTRDSTLDVLLRNMIPKYPIFHLLLVFFVGCSEKQTETEPEAATPAEPGSRTIPEKFHGLWHLDDDGTLRPIDFYVLVTEAKLYSFGPDGQQTGPVDTGWVLGDTLWVLEGEKEKRDSIGSSTPMARI